MKIDQDLRAAINAAAKVQPEYGYNEENKQITERVDAFLKKKPAVKRKAASLIQQIADLKLKESGLREKAKALLSPFGLYINDQRVSANFRRDMDDVDAQKFVKAGGEIPPPAERRWKAETVIAKLAAAKPEKRDAILKEYGIDWS